MSPDELRAVLTGTGGPSRGRRSGGGNGHITDYREEALIARRHNVRRSVPHRWDTVITLDLKGWTNTEIAEYMKVTQARVSTIRSTTRYREEKARRLSNLDREFESLKPLAIEALKTGLKSKDENAALRASEQWFKTAGYGTHGSRPDEATGLTAEAVAAAIVKQTVNVTVNINRDEIATIGIDEPGEE